MSSFGKFKNQKLSYFYKRSNLICYLVIILIFWLDRISKIKIIDQQNNSLIYINDYINLDLTWNTGIGFGLLSESSNLFYNTITGLIGFVIAVLVYLILKAKLVDKIIYSFIVGGAVGNFYDRFVYASVPDFIDIHYKNFHWFTFNIADIFISFGIIMLIGIDLILKKK